MATSPSHQIGEFVGDFFEKAVIDYFRPLVTTAGFYLDYRHSRPARENMKEVMGNDKDGNHHKLDIVIEKDGSEEVFGQKKAFIEVAWRRYVKHSKNKVQEISGAILPLVETYQKESPFYAVALSGEFTENSLNQLRSEGFHVLYIPYNEMCDLFDSVGVSIRTEEDTSLTDLKRIVSDLYGLKKAEILSLESSFNTREADKLLALKNDLFVSLQKHVASVIVWPIHSSPTVLSTVSNAVDFILSYQETNLEPVLRYEILIKYSNNDEVSLKCTNKSEAIRSLRQYL